MLMHACNLGWGPPYNASLFLLARGHRPRLCTTGYMELRQGMYKWVAAGLQLWQGMYKWVAAGRARLPHALRVELAEMLNIP